jgi:hypothetical protein
MVSYSVLTRAPGAFSKPVPKTVRKVVLRCLEKDPARRYQDAGELARALEKELQRKPLPKALRALQAAALGLVTLAAAVALFTGVRSLLRPPPAVQQITRLPGAVWTARFAPDAKTIYFGEAFDGQPPRVLKTRVGHPEEQEEVLGDALVLAVAPNEDLAVLLHPLYREQGFVGTLAVLPKAGGPPKVVADKVRAADFAPDGTLAIARTNASHATLESPPGKVLYEGTGRILYPRWSRSGDRLAFVHQSSLLEVSGSVMVTDRAGQARVLLPDQLEANGLAWSRDGSELFFSGLPRGAPAAVTTLRALDRDGGARPLSLQNLADVEVRDVSLDGAVLLTQPTRTIGLQISDERGDRSLALQSEQLLFDLSADGSRVLFTADPKLKSRQGYLFVRPTDGGPAVRFGLGYGGALSPDGKSALIFDWADKRLPLALHTFATGQEEALPWATLGVLRARFFPDGRRVLVVGQGERPEPRLFVVSLDERKVSLVSQVTIDQRQGFVASPDGAQVVAVTADGKVMRWPASGGEGQPVAGVEPGESPFLFDASGGLVVGKLDGITLNLHRLDLATAERRPLPALSLHGAHSAQVARLSLARGGAAAAYAPVGWSTHLYLAEGLR